MKLNYLSVLLITAFTIVTSASCQSDNTEGLFNETFGLNDSKTLNLIIDEAETILEETYSTKGFENVADKFLLDLLNTEGKVFINNLNREDIKAIDSLFNQDSLKYKIWNITNVNGNEKFDFKLDGIYLRAFEALKDKNEIARKYYDANLTAGSVPYKLMISDIIKGSKNNLSHFLMKRIIIVDIFYIYALSLI